MNFMLRNKIDLLVGNAFDESKHPRGKGGQFGAGGAKRASAQAKRVNQAAKDSLAGLAPFVHAKSAGFKKVSSEMTSGAQKSWMSHPSMSKADAIKHFGLTQAYKGGEYSKQTKAYRVALLGPKDVDSNKTHILIERFRKGPAGR
jgi:hypothetical protein